jgi:hypothetical protein
MPDVLGGLKQVFLPRRPQFEADDMAEAREEECAPHGGKKDEAKERAKGGEARAAQLKGRVLVATERELVLEVQVGAEGLAWAPRDVVIRMADGQLRKAKLDLTRTTRAGQLSSGMVLRIVLELEQPGPWIAPPVAVLVNTTPSGYELEINL